MNLIGGPAMTPREFSQRVPATTLGVEHEREPAHR
jgi:hypothetical protein